MVNMRLEREGQKMKTAAMQQRRERIATTRQSKYDLGRFKKEGPAVKEPKNRHGGIKLHLGLGRSLTGNGV